MTALPLDFYGQTVGINQLSGQNYVQGWPELVQLILAASQNPSFGYALPPCFVYPTPGKQRVYAIKGRSWMPGQRLRAYRFGNAGDYRTVMVHAYDFYSGILDIEVVASSTYETEAGAATGYYFTPYFSEPIGASLVSIATGGTGGSDIDSSRKALLLPTQRNYSIFYSDFVNPNSWARHSINNVDKGAASFNNTGSGSLNIDYQNHPGILYMQNVVSVNDVEVVSFGRPFEHGWCDMSGDDTMFESLFYFPALSVSGAYLFETGLIGSQAKIAVSYMDTLNTGKFQILSGVGASYSTFNSALTVASSTWYKVNISISGANVAITINGANGTTVAKSTFQGVTDLNKMIPMARLTMKAAGTINSYLDYLYFRRHFNAGR